MDPDQAALTASQEEHRVRATELQSLTVELNRWRSLYLAALVGAATWLVRIQLTGVLA